MSAGGTGSARASGERGKTSLRGAARASETPTPATEPPRLAQRRLCCSLAEGGGGWMGARACKGTGSPPASARPRSSAAAPAPGAVRIAWPVGATPPLKPPRHARAGKPRTSGTVHIPRGGLAHGAVSFFSRRGRDSPQEKNFAVGCREGDRAAVGFLSLLSLSTPAFRP